MKIGFVFSFLFLFGGAKVLVGQNLVPNPSFEIYTSCPDDVGLIDSAIGWTIFGSCQPWGPGTPDYYNACADQSQHPDSLAGIPNNFAGFQYPATGNACAGLISYAITVVNCREIIGCRLKSPLEIGETYQVSFKANCSFGGLMGNYLASNGLGAEFKMNPYSNSNPIPIDNNPDVYTTQVITDTLNWTTIEGTFVADSAYEYLAIGNFIQDASLDTIHLSSFIFRSYYYIDDVSVIKQTNNSIGGMNGNRWKVFPNPVSDILYVKNENKFIQQISLCDKMGQIVFRQTENLSKSANISIDVKNLPTGIYFIQLSAAKDIHQQVLLIQH